MAILIDNAKSVMIQGITGREGKIRTHLMVGFGTRVVAGVTPGRGGVEVEGIKVYDSVNKALYVHGPVDISVIFVPAPLVKDAALEAFASGIKLVVVVPDRVPIYDVMAIVKYARLNQASFIGPNTLGVLTPGEGILGMIGGSAENARDWFQRGPVGITSRIGGMTTSTAYYLNRAGIGQSTIVHVGGDSLVGLPHQEIVALFQEDEETELVVLLGEIGGSQEEEVARLIREGRFTKPIVAYIGGRGAKEGVRFSHAGAIVEGTRGTYEGKVEHLRKAGAKVVEDVNEIPEAVKSILDKRGGALCPLERTNGKQRSLRSNPIKFLFTVMP